MFTKCQIIFIVLVQKKLISRHNFILLYFFIFNQLCIIITFFPVKEKVIWCSSLWAGASGWRWHLVRCWWAVDGVSSTNICNKARGLTIGGTFQGTIIWRIVTLGCALWSLSLWEEDKHYCQRQNHQCRSGIHLGNV